jgi:hypothetical protein
VADTPRGTMLQMVMMKFLVKKVGLNNEAEDLPRRQVFPFKSATPVLTF